MKSPMVWVVNKASHRFGPLITKKVTLSDIHLDSVFKRKTHGIRFGVSGAVGRVSEAHLYAGRHRWAAVL
eukprot:107575-Amorphochlora_amoeboformis.AAC.1